VLIAHLLLRLGAEGDQRHKRQCENKFFHGEKGCGFRF
jgi:hypothetical protein